MNEDRGKGWIALVAFIVYILIIISLLAEKGNAQALDDPRMAIEDDHWVLYYEGNPNMPERDTLKGYCLWMIPTPDGGYSLNQDEVIIVYRIDYGVGYKEINGRWEHYYPSNRDGYRVYKDNWVQIPNRLIIKIVE